MAGRFDYRIRFVVALFCLCNGICRAPGGDFYISDPVAFNSLRLVPHIDDLRHFVRVATSGTNCIVTWSSGAQWPSEVDGSLTNIYAASLTSTGFDDPVGRRIAKLGSFDGPVQMLPFDGGFFGLFTRRATSGELQEMIGRYDLKGNQLTEPVTYSTNVVPRRAGNAVAASNGRRVIITTSVDPISYMISDGQNIVARGELGVSIEITNAFVSGFGTNFVYAWRENGNADVLVTSISDDTGSGTTRTIATNATIRALGSSDPGYLLAVMRHESPFSYATDLLRLDEGANVVAGATVNSHFAPDNRFEPTIIPFLHAWGLFELNSAGFRDLFVTTNAGGLSLFTNLFYAQNFASNNPASYGVAPLGNGRAILIGQVGPNVILQILRLPQIFALPAPASEMAPVVAAGSSSYLVAWCERGKPRRILGLRLQKDGTRIDREPFEISVVDRDAREIKAAFNATDYLVAWQFLDYFSQMQLAFVAGAGPPNVRELPALPPSANGFDLVRRGSDVLITGETSRAVMSDGAIGPPPINFSYQGFVSDGQELLQALHDYSNVVNYYPGMTVRRVGFDGPSGVPLLLGYGVDLVGVGRDGEFLFVWANEWQLHYARVRNMTRIDGGILPVQLTNNINIGLAASAGEFMIVVNRREENNRATDYYIKIDRVTGGLIAKRTVAAGIDFDYGVQSLASIDKDFLLVSARGTERQFVTHQWIPAAPTLKFEAARFGAGMVNAGLQLDSTRRYRIESSEDFTNWNLLNEQTGTDAFDLSEPPQNAQRFYRAALVPE